MSSAATPNRPLRARRRATRGPLTPSGLPRWLLLPAGLGALLVLLPVAAMFLQVSWSDLPSLLTSESAVDALLLSLRTAASATALCLLLGVPLAAVLAQARFRGVGLLRGLVLLPLVLPPVVGGIALLTVFGRQGLLGGALEVLGMQIAYSTVAVVLAQTFVSLPFLVVTVETALRDLDRQMIEAAVMDGAGRTMVLRAVALPLILPSLVSGVILAFARSLGEFGATIAFAGSLQGVTRTLPLEIYLQRETDPQAAVALSLLLVLAALLVIGLAGSRRGRP
ncbi:molybdate transport system permease protein [Nesterenkonia lacusekhoensis]|uniref:Molybdenum transport system permease n=1 Tax=Nesterenkonia lacusekhoensis TaxID=150832 RepID=A0ABS4T353_9MICC|nr:molybdate transport system permease protein [Nesterenkonia lacusekhoensis]